MIVVTCLVDANTHDVSQYVIYDIIKRMKRNSTIKSTHHIANLAIN